MSRHTPSHRPSSPRQSSEAASNTWNSRLAVFLLMGLSAFGAHKWTQSRADEKIHTLEKKLATGKRAEGEAKETANQCEQAMSARPVVEKPVPVVLPCPKQDDCAEPDEAECQGVMDRAARDGAENMARLLCIENELDITLLSQYIRHGYTQLSSVANGTELTLIDPKTINNGQTRIDFFYLGEPAKCVPDEYISRDHDGDSGVSVLADKLKDDGRAELLVKDFDLNSICPSLKGHPFEDQVCKDLSKLQQDLSTTSDFDQRRVLICENVIKTFSQINQEIEANSGFEAKMTDEEDSKSKEMFVYMEALLAHAGLSNRGSYEEAAMKCMVDMYKSQVSTKNPNEADLDK